MYVAKFFFLLLLEFYLKDTDIDFSNSSGLNSTLIVYM